MFRMNLARLWAAAAVMLFAGQETALMQASRQYTPGAKGRVKSKRPGKPKADRPNVVYCRADRYIAIPYEQLSPKIDGVRMRWEGGFLVPRTAPAILGRPISKRTEERRRAQRLRRKAAEGATPPKRRMPKGTLVRGDLKGTMRAQRRAGVISARQQKRLHKMERLL